MTAETSNAREWVLVPREPTQAMLDSVCSAEGIEPWTDDIMRQTYIAMLEAAPPPAAARGDVRGLVDVVRDLRHSAVVDDYEIDQIAFISSIADRIESALAAEGVQAGEVSAYDLAVLDDAAETLDRIGEGSAGLREARARIASALSQQPEAQGVVAWLRHRPDGTPDWDEDCIGTSRHFLPHGLKSAGYTLRPLIYGDTAPPSAPVGVDKETERRLIDVAASMLNDNNGKIGKKHFRADATAVVRRVLKALAQQPWPKPEARGGGEVVATIQRPGWPRKDSAVFFTMEHAAYDLPPGTPLYTAPPSAPVGVAEALQRLIENAATLGPASMEDALLVARHRALALTAAQQRGQGGGEVEPDGYTSYGEFRWACDCDERQRREWTPVYLAPPSAPSYRDAYEGAREDLLDWKGRAQRAEARLRGLGYAGIDASQPPSAPVGVKAVVASLRECELFLRTMGLESDAARRVADDARSALAALAQQPAAREEMSPDFTDSARAAIAWVLYHHQGGSSPIGQPLRFALGMGADERLPDWRIAEAKRWAEWAGATTADFHRHQQPAACGTCREAIRPDALTGTTCKCAQQPAAVDESFVERFCGRWFQLTGRSLDRPSVRACLTEALATQHQEPTT